MWKCRSPSKCSHASTTLHFPPRPQTRFSPRGPHGCTRSKMHHQSNIPTLKCLVPYGAVDPEMPARRVGSPPSRRKREPPTSTRLPTHRPVDQLCNSVCNGDYSCFLTSQTNRITPSQRYRNVLSSYGRNNWQDTTYKTFNDARCGVLGRFGCRFRPSSVYRLPV